MTLTAPFNVPPVEAVRRVLPAAALALALPACNSFIPFAVLPPFAAPAHTEPAGHHAN
jgi:hypothetical protein